MKQLLIVCLLVFISSSAFAGTQYYLDPSCTYNGNGLTSTCAASAGASGAYNTCFTLSGTGSDLSIKAGTTLANCRIPITASGTSGDHVVITRYGAGDDPVLDGAVTQANSWTLSSGNIYYSSNTTSVQYKVVTVDGVRLKAVSSLGAMTAGTHFTDTAASRLYIWMSAGGNPTGHTVEYAANTTAYYDLIDTAFSNVSYIDVSYLTLKRSHNMNIHLGYGSGSCTNCSISHVTSTMSGSRGIMIAGNNPTITYNTCSDNNSEITSPDNACIVREAKTGTVNTGGEVAYNTVSNTRYGSCYEINASGADSGVDGTWFHDNVGTQCRSGLELFGCNTTSGSGVCTGVVNSIIEKNHWSGSGLTQIGSGYGRCTGGGNNASYNTWRNNICEGFSTKGFHVLNGRLANQGGHHNKFYNNTEYATDVRSSSSNAAMGGDIASGNVGGNEWKNNIVYLPNGGRCIYTASGVTGDIYDKNICYSASGNWATYAGVDKATMSAYKTAYTTATTLTDNSSNVDPDINLSTFMPNVSSPTIGFGLTTLGVTEDYNGVSRGASNDAGAVSYVSPSLPATRIIRGNGTVLRNFTFN